MTDKEKEILDVNKANEPVRKVITQQFEFSDKKIYNQNTYEVEFLPSSIARNFHIQNTFCKQENNKITKLTEIYAGHRVIKISDVIYTD
jgi:hypothetical protein